MKNITRALHMHDKNGNLLQIHVYIAHDLMIKHIIRVIMMWEMWTSVYES